jgi:fructuronate reductase
VTTGTGPVPLSRKAVSARPAAPVRQVHLGLGNFFRAHQAYYTDSASDADGWGIAAFTGRSPDLARAMSGQDCLYTLITKAPQGQRFDVISSVSKAHAGGDLDSWLRYLASPETRILTLTVTEAAYCRNEDGGLDAGMPTVLADIANLKMGRLAMVSSVPGRLVAGLAARRAADAGSIAVVPCDNLSGNGSVVSRLVTEMAELVDPTLAGWINESASFVTTMVDRITPRASPADSRAVERQTGLRDCCPVVTEPFTEWVLQGEFPDGRPRWEEAGAQFVDDVTPFEERKLWLLNGAHSLLAYAGSIRGHTTVVQAIADDTVREWVEQWWDESSRHLTQPSGLIEDYRRALLERFGNPAIRHRLDQIAADGSQKLPERTLPVLALERRDGRMPRGATRTLAAWVLHLRGVGAPVTDASKDALVALAAGPLAPAVHSVLTFLDPQLGEDDAVAGAVLAQAEELAAS